MEENATIHLIPNKKGNETYLLNVLKQMPGVSEIKVMLHEHQIHLKLSDDLTIQDVINEINMKTGFRAY